MLAQVVLEAPLVAETVPVAYIPGPEPLPISTIDFGRGPAFDVQQPGIGPAGAKHSLDTPGITNLNQTLKSLRSLVGDA
jgi:hypothetical protein